MLEKVKKEQGLDENELLARNDVAGQVEALLASRFPGTKVLAFGSSLSGFGLRSSSVDLKLHLPPEYNPSRGMATAAVILREAAFQRLLRTFTAKYGNNNCFRTF